MRWTDRVSNKEIWRRTGQIPVGVEIEFKEMMEMD